MEKCYIVHNTQKDTSCAVATCFVNCDSTMNRTTNKSAEESAMLLVTQSEETSLGVGQLMAS